MLRPEEEIIKINMEGCKKEIECFLGSYRRKANQ